jgi:hypothetical protein
MKNKKQLTREQRYEIEVLLRAGEPGQTLSLQEKKILRLKIVLLL